MTRYLRDQEWSDLVTERDGTPRVYRSVREARRQLLDAAQHFDRLSRVGYQLDLVTTAGEVIPVRQSVVDHVQEWSAWDQWDRSIGRRLERGETVAA